MIDKLSNQNWGSYSKSHRDTKSRVMVAENLDPARLTVGTILANTSIKLHELINLQAGDVIITEKPANSPLTLTVGGKRKYIGHIGQYRGNRAFKVDRAYSIKDRV